MSVADIGIDHLNLAATMSLIRVSAGQEGCDAASPGRKRTPMEGELLSAETHANLGRRTARWSNGHLTWPSTRRLPVQIRHASPWPHRLLARIRPFQGREDGSEPSGAANLAWPNGRAADCYSEVWRFDSSRESQGVLAQLVRAPGRQLGSHGFKSRRSRFAPA